MGDSVEQKYLRGEQSFDRRRTTRILHVDDDDALAELTAISLQRERDSFDVDIAIGGPAALERLEAETFDCLVSDYDMPELTGLDLLRAVRSTHPDLPFILYTGKGSEEIASDAIAAGVTDYLQKQTGSDQYTVLANRISNAVEHARAEEALRETEQRYRTAVQGSHDAVYIYQDGEFRFVNGRACEMTGYSEDELLEQSIWDFVHPDDREQAIEYAQRRKSGESVPPQYDARVVTKDGDVRHCEFSVEAISYGGEYAVLGSVRDTTDYRRTQERYRALIEHSTDIITVIDTNGTIRYESPSVERVLGYTPEELVGESAFSYIHPDDQQTAFESFAEALEHDDFYETHLEVRFKHADGSWHWLGIVGNNGPHSMNEEFVLNCRSIHDRREREARLHRHKAKVEALHDVATDIEACHSEDDICSLMLSAAENVLDFDLCCINKHVDGTLPIVAISSDAPADHTAEFSVDDGIAGKTFRTGESFLIDDVQSTPDAEPQGAYHAAISVPIGDWGTFQTVAEEPGSFDDEDLAVAELLVAHAATALSRVEHERELREREHELREQNERLDEFASVVSHDLRNPLNVAQGRLTLLDETGDESHLPHVERSLERIEHIVADVLELARSGGVTVEDEQLSLATVANAAWDAVETDGATLAVDTELTVRGNAIRLQRLFENLYRNSIEHGAKSAAASAVDSGTCQDSVDVSSLTITVGDCPDGFFVADDGCGIPPASRDHIFEQSFSTSQTGTGLGLDIVQTIARTHGWSVALDPNSDERGARFTVTGLDESDEQ